MKGKIVALLIISTLLLGCQSKVASNNQNQINQASTSQSNIGAQNSTSTQISTNNQSESSATTNGQQSSIKPGTVKALSEEQKLKINQKVETALNNVNNALQSVQDVPDVDISSIDK